MYRPYVDDYIGSDVDRHTLGLVYGRRRIGKSTLLQSVTYDNNGFYWEAPRANSADQLRRFGDALGEHLGVGSLAMPDWDTAIDQLLRLGADKQVPAILDEFGYLLESDPSVDSVISRALGPGNRRQNPGRTRLVLCGSAIGVLSNLTAGNAPLRGRAGMELLMRPADYRAAAEQQFGSDTNLGLAARVYAVIGGVIGYATDMVGNDLPSGPQDFDRWIVQRVLSPASPLRYEGVTLLAEDPSLTSSTPAIYHSILGAIANGLVGVGKIANQLRRSAQSIEPTLKRLTSAGLVTRLTDPVRMNRPSYLLNDPFLRFHYAVLEPHEYRLRPPADLESVWGRLRSTFDSQVRGPVFEEQARTWVQTHAGPETLGDYPEHVGPSTVTIDAREYQIDVVAAVGRGSPSDRTVLAIGEAKAGEKVGAGHLRKLEQARFALGVKAARAKLLLFAPDFSEELLGQSSSRPDIELIDLQRLYYGS